MFNDADDNQKFLGSTIRVWLWVLAMPQIIASIVLWVLLALKLKGNFKFTFSTEYIPVAVVTVSALIHIIVIQLRSRVVYAFLTFLAILLMIGVIWASVFPVKTIIETKSYENWPSLLFIMIILLFLVFSLFLIVLYYRLGFRGKRRRGGIDSKSESTCDSSQSDYGSEKSVKTEHC